MPERNARFLNTEVNLLGGFLLAGCCGLLVDIGVLLLLLAQDWNFAWARVGSISVAIGVTWLINRLLVFRTQPQPALTEYLRHLAVQVMGASINFSVYWYLLTYHIANLESPVIALMFGSATALAFTYIGSRLWVYRGHRASM